MNQEDVPMYVLFAMLLLAVVVLWMAQRKDGFDMADMLRDDSGKPSALRFAVLASLATSMWVVMRDTLRPDGVDATIFLIFCATWSGAPVAAKALEVWKSRGKDDAK